MFNFLKRNKDTNKNNNSIAIGVQKYYQLKQILKNEDVLTPILTQTPASLSIAPDVIEANNLINHISTLTGLSEMDVISCGASAASEQHKERYDETIIAMIKEKEALEHKEIISEDNGWLDTLIEWANNNNLAEFQNYSTIPAYPQTGFPREKSQLLSLESLYIPKSGISYLPPELGKLRKLRGICLDGNNIDKYPEEMCHYKNLIRLDLDDNNISNFPKEIGNLTSLQVLSLENNSINDFPIEMKKLVNIRKLVLKGQAIHLSSKYSPLSEDGFKVYQFFTYDMDVTKEESVQSWLDKTDTSNLTMTG